MAARWPTAGDLMTPRPITVAPGEPVSKALGYMRTRRIHELPVLNKRRLVGMITFDAIARRTNLALSTKVEKVMVLPPVVTPATGYVEVAEQLLASGLRAAPVTGKRDELLGVVSRTDLVREFGRIDVLSRHRVDEVMSPITLVLQETDRCGTLFGQDQLRQIESHPLPVVDRKGKLVGAVGVVDLGEVLWRPRVGGKKDAATEGSVFDIEVRTIMHTPPVTTPRGTPTGTAAVQMTREKVSSVFIVEGDKPVGVVSQSDLLGLAIGEGGAAGGTLGDVFVQIQGLRASNDPSVLADIDRVVARGLRRISRYVRPVMLNLHVSPHATHRSGEATVEGRLHTEHGIVYASRTGWNLYAALADLLDEIESQTRRVKEERFHGRGRASRRRRETVPSAEPTVDPELEARIRTATGGPPG
jgi:ribosomal subunit interface protein